MTRRHRFVTVPSGLLLFACLFLPAIEACGDPVRPYEVGAVPPYLAGVFVAVLALVRPSVRRVMTKLARVLLWVGAAILVVTAVRVIVDVTALPWVLASLMIAVALAYVLGTDPAGDELSAARLTIALALLGVVGFGMFMFEHALYGLYLSGGASVGLFVGGLEWRREILRDR